MKKTVSIFLVVMMLASMVCVSASAKSYAVGNSQHGVSCIVNYKTSVVGTASSSTPTLSVKVSTRMQYWEMNFLLGDYALTWGYSGEKSGNGTVKATVTRQGCEVNKGYANGKVGSKTYNNVGGSW